LKEKKYRTIGIPLGTTIGILAVMFVFAGGQLIGAENEIKEASIIQATVAQEIITEKLYYPESNDSYLNLTDQGLVNINTKHSEDYRIVVESSQGIRGIKVDESAWENYNVGDKVSFKN